MLIAIDIGNTRIKAGKFTNDKLTEIFSSQDTSEVLTFLKSYTKSDFAIASVVPDKTKIFSDEVYRLTGKFPFIISIDIKKNLAIVYKTPETLGTDRLCSAEGAFFLYKNSKKYKTYNKGTYILTIDFGTATTVNVIEHPGKFIGGLIAPGFEMMFESLKQKTAQLPYLDVSSFTSTIGNETNSSIASGIVTSVVGMIEKIINYLVRTMHALSLHIYITGGNATKIIPHLNFDIVHEEGLVLYGIYALWELNKTPLLPSS